MIDITVFLFKMQVHYVSMFYSLEVVGRDSETQLTTVIQLLHKLEGRKPDLDRAFLQCVAVISETF